MVNAIEEIHEELLSGERIEAIVIGDWQIGDAPHPEVPEHMRHRPLTEDQAAPYLQGWRTRGGYGSAEVYALYVWTDQRVALIEDYDGATRLCWVPRHPCACKPEMAGGE